MDNNNQNPAVNNPAVTPTPAQTPPANTGPVQPVVPQTPVTPSSGDSKKMILWLVIGLVVVVALVGGIYFFLSKQQSNNAAQTTTIQPTAQDTRKAPDTVDALDRDLSALNIDNTDSDFAQVDQDLQQL